MDTTITAGLVRQRIRLCSPAAGYFPTATGVRAGWVEMFPRDSPNNLWMWRLNKKLNLTILALKRSRLGASPEG